MMFSVWKSLSLLCLLQHSVSSDEAVSLICPKTVSVISGKKVVQNCSIEFKNGSGCEVEDSVLSHSNGTTKCGNDSEPYSCAWDTNSTVTVTIVGVKEDNITVEIRTKCGWASDDIHVHINVHINVDINVDIETKKPPAPVSRIDKKKTRSYLISIILGVLATVIVAILFCLIKSFEKEPRTHRGEPAGSA